MPYKASSLQSVLDSFEGETELSPTQIAHKINKTKTIVHKYLKELVRQWKLQKLWSAPHVKYVSLVTKKKQEVLPVVLRYEDAEIIQHEFYKFSEDGTLLEWVEGFLQRCQQRWLDPLEKSKIYAKVKKYIDTLKNQCGLIETTETFTNHVATMSLDKTYYADQYNWMEFGRGRLAEMTFYAKQSQQIWLINKCIDLVYLKIQCLVQHEHIDAIAIIPPSITRINQFLKIVSQRLQALDLPFITLSKFYRHKIPIPQKSLKTREQRIRNAQETILVNHIDIDIPRKVLLIDDFVWSGSTLNETAAKLKALGIETVVWFAFVGNANLKYEVIHEV